jgi:hypothetical protein
MNIPTQTASKTIYVTRTGLPLRFKLEWPFRHATSGADFDVLHTVITLENTDGLRALVAVNLSATLRTEVDQKQTEFVKSGKLVPLPLSSRHYSFKLKQWVFGKATDEEIVRLIERKVYWQTRLVGGDAWLGDPIEALYLDTTTDHIVEIAAELANRGLFSLARRFATALPALMDQQERFENEMIAAQRQLEEKHVFERG